MSSSVLEFCCVALVGGSLEVGGVRICSLSGLFLQYVAMISSL